MRTKIGPIALLACVLCVAGCAASQQEVSQRLGSQYVGQNVDALVVKFGPPASSFRMNSGATSYVWNLAAITDIDLDKGSGTASTRTCSVRVISNPAGIVTQLDTEDANLGPRTIPGYFGLYGSVCAQRLGMKPST